ncbi:TetR/AcrR family transcriptional regulator [Solihabitans fulvus]|uniref:TetR/AcrR family transcriptional regulator n=1 Tax=Solihabitans fulvus TaxID=1892852 RepID=A0A5B2XRU0_9PSEU|nr:TetR/AcrR family transcriptional regulator [Solihabitans fulvus]
MRVAVLAATLAELIDRGYAALTVDQVAQRAGVHKTTVYRRWTDRQAVVVDALTDLVGGSIQIPDSGTVEDDLRELARSLVRWLTSPAGRAVHAVIQSDAVRVPEIAEVQRRFIQDRYRRAEPVVRRAIERGELPAETDPTDLLRMLIAPIHFRLHVAAEPVDEATADRAARATLAAARAGALNRQAATVSDRP